MRHIASLASTSAQFAKIAVAPRVDLAVVGEGQGLGVTWAQGYLDDALAWEGFHLREKMTNNNGLFEKHFYVAKDNLVITSKQETSETNMWFTLHEMNLYIFLF